MNQCTPCNAVYGRVPALLPGIDHTEAPNEQNLSVLGTIRHTHRIREISVQLTIEGAAKARLHRAMQTKSLPAGQREDYRPGDLVDFHRPPNSKDASGWIGLATVIDTTHISRGHVTLKHIHLPFQCRLQDMRRHIPFVAFHAAFHSAMSGSQGTWDEIKQHVERLSA